jgi:hypothetical protein
VARSLSSYIPIGRAIAHPQETIKKAGLVFFAGLTLGLLVPGYLYDLSGTFYKNDISRRLLDSPKIDPKARDIWNRYQETRDGLQNSVSVIDKEIASQGRALPLSDKAVNDKAVKDIASLVEQRAKLQSALDKLTAGAPFHMSGFYLESLMIAWPAFYIGLGCLIFILAPHYPRPTGIRRWIGLLVGTWVFYRWPTWMRNLPYLHLREIERHVYANGNWDVSRGSFLVQEGQGVVASILLVAIWAIWADFIPLWQAQVRECLWGDGSKERLAEFAESFVRLFVHWQVSSVVLAAAFIPYTFFFWNYVIEFGDKRYLAHALIMHGIWGVTWLLISLPLAWTWYQWNVRYRLNVQMAAGPSGPEPPSSGIEMSSLIGSWNVMGSLATAALAFGFPLVKEILTHL